MISLVDYPNSNETRKKFKAIQIKEGSLILSHAVCDRCFSVFSQIDKHGHLTGANTLARHLNICRPATDTLITSFGQLAKKSNCFYLYIQF